jgi:hypothetical protein
MIRPARFLLAALLLLHCGILALLQSEAEDGMTTKDCRSPYLARKRR